MNKREEKYYSYFEQKTSLERKLEGLSEEKILRKRMLDEEIDIQDELIRLLNQIGDEDPEMAENAVFWDSFCFLKEKANCIVDSRQENYEQICRECRDTEMDIDDLQTEYQNSLWHDEPEEREDRITDI